MRTLAVLFTLLLLAMGCSADRPVAVTPPPAVEQLKVSLTEIGKSGELGSGFDELPRLVAELKEAQPEKAAALESDLEKLRTARGPAAVRAAAKAMAEKL